MKYIDMFHGYDAKKRFCPIVDNVSRTIQDAIVDIPSLLKAFGGKIDDLFDKFNNGLLYESDNGKGIFLDELNSEEVSRYNEFVANQQKKEEEAKHEAELFEQFKQEIANRVVEKRVDNSSSDPSVSE